MKSNNKTTEIDWRKSTHQALISSIYYMEFIKHKLCECLLFGWRSQLVGWLTVPHIFIYNIDTSMSQLIFSIRWNCLQNSNECTPLHWLHFISKLTKNHMFEIFSWVSYAFQQDQIASIWQRMENVEWICTPFYVQLSPYDI